jgi:hypothetical protein
MFCVVETACFEFRVIGELRGRIPKTLTFSVRFEAVSFLVGNVLDGQENPGESEDDEQPANIANSRRLNRTHI